MYNSKKCGAGPGSEDGELFYQLHIENKPLSYKYHENVLSKGFFLKSPLYPSYCISLPIKVKLIN